MLGDPDGQEAALRGTTPISGDLPAAIG